MAGIMNSNGALRPSLCQLWVLYAVFALRLAFVMCYPNWAQGNFQGAHQPGRKSTEISNKSVKDWGIPVGHQVTCPSLEQGPRLCPLTAQKEDGRELTSQRWAPRQNHACTTALFLGGTPIPFSFCLLSHLPIWTPKKARARKLPIFRNSFFRV